MADVKFAVLRGVLSQDIGTPDTDFTETDFGTPKAAIVILGNAWNSTDPDQDAMLSVGIWDGTRMRSAYGGSDNAVDITDCNRGYAQDTIAAIRITTTSSAEYTISNITDGVRITLTVDNISASRYATVLLIGGDDVSAYAGTVTPGTPSGASTTVTAPGFRPDIVFMIGAACPLIDTTQNLISFGAATQVGGMKNYMVQAYDYDARSASSLNGTYASETYCVGQIFAGVFTWGAYVKAFTDTGFILYTGTGATGGDIAGYLALKLGGYNAKLHEIATPTSTGLVKTEGFGFEPSHLLVFLSKAQAWDSLGYNGFNLTVGMSDGTTESSVCAFSRSTAATSLTGSTSREMLIDQRNEGTSGVLITATVDSFDSDGYTLNYDNTYTSTRYGFGIALQTEENKRVISTANGFLGMTGG